MGGLSIVLFTKGRERVVWSITFGIVILLAALSPQPLRRIENGREVVYPVLFGHVLPTWPMLIGILLVIGIVRFGVDRLLNRFWPEKGETFVADKVYERPGGGFVAWQGDDPEAGSPFDYVAPRLRTALDYLQAEEPAPMRVLILGPEGADAECAAFHAEMARWREETPDETLRDLVPAARAMGSAFDDEAVWRLTDAAEERGVPSLDELAAFANETGNEALQEYVAEKRA